MRNFARAAAVGALVVAALFGGSGVQASTTVTVDLGTTPTGDIVVDASHHHVFVAMPQRDVVRVYGYGGRLVARVAMSHPVYMTESPSEGTVYVTSGVGGGHAPSGIVAISTSTLRERWRMPGGSRCLSGIALAASRAWTVSGCYGTGRLISFAPGDRSAGWRPTSYDDVTWPARLSAGGYGTGLLAATAPGSNSDIRVWHVSGASARQRTDREDSAGPEYQAGFTEHGRKLLISEGLTSNEHGSELIDPLDTTAPVKRYATTGDYVTAAIASGSGRHVVEGSHDGLALYDSSSPSAPRRQWATGYIYYGDLAAAPDGSKLAYIVWTINTYDGYHPTHYHLVVRTLGVANW